jgi:hypothetical protein
MAEITKTVMKRVHQLLVVILVCVLLGCPVRILQHARDERIRVARRLDVQALAPVCVGFTNITSSEDMFAVASRQNVRLRSPIPKDPSKPCYRLVNPWSSQNGLILNKILIEEINTTDTNQAVIAVMDGSVMFVSRKRLDNVIDLNKR